VLVAVKDDHFEAWHAFVGDLGVALPASLPEVRRWALAAIGHSEAAASAEHRP
jgi:hypothetical protein